MTTRLLAALIGALVIALPVRAQDLRVGVGAGASSYAFVVAGADSRQSARTHVTVGVHAEYRMTPMLGTEIGLSWVAKTSRGTVQGFEEPITTDIRLDYLHIPALVRLSIPLGKFVTPSIVAGPALSLEARCEERSQPGTIAIHVECDDTDRARADWGILVGGGVVREASRTAVALEGRFELGLRDLDTIESMKTRSRGFTLTARVSRALQ